MSAAQQARMVNLLRAALDRHGVRATIARLAAGDRDLTIRVLSDDALFIRGAIGEVLGSMGLSVLIVAVVVIFKLRSILGRRTGEGKLSHQY